MHKFDIGQTVFLVPVPCLKIAGGACIVTRKLPERGGQFVHQVKSTTEPYERVVGQTHFVLRRPTRLVAKPLLSRRWWDDNSIRV
jgi:hypothetical protein